MTKEQIIEEAKKRGIVPGAVVDGPHHKGFTVTPFEEWLFVDSDAFVIPASHATGAWVYREGEWATVVTPAPQAGGLEDGMACEPDEHMRAAIVAKAKELGNNGPDQYTAQYLVWDKKTMLWQSFVNGDYRLVSPGEFYDRLCRMPKPEPTIMIGAKKVEFRSGSIEVGCTTIDNATVKLIASKLID